MQIWKQENLIIWIFVLWESKNLGLGICKSDNLEIWRPENLGFKSPEICKFVNLRI